jgi:hypothetical protein
VVSVMHLLLYFGVVTAPSPVGQETWYVRSQSGPYGIYLSVIPITHNSASNDRMILNYEFVGIRKERVAASNFRVLPGAIEEIQENSVSVRTFRNGHPREYKLEVIPLVACCLAHIYT